MLEGSARWACFVLSWVTRGWVRGATDPGPTLNSGTGTSDEGHGKGPAQSPPGPCALLSIARTRSPLSYGTPVIASHKAAESVPAAPLTLVIAIARRHSAEVGPVVPEESVVARSTAEVVVTAGAWRSSR